MGETRIELVFCQRPVTPSELDRDIIKPARREAAIEMPHSRNDDPHHRYLDVGARLIEHEKIEACLSGECHAGGHLLACVETAELRTEAWWGGRLVAWRQKGMVLKAKWRGAVKARFFSGPAAHQADG